MSCAYSLVCPGGKMVGAWSFIFLVFLHVANAQSCSVDFAVLEGALLENHVNAYQIANAFFQPRTDGETLCVTAYYYLGLNSTEEDKSNCPSITSNEDGVVSGCSKWKWCINTFYMDLNIAQLQIFTFFAIYERVSEIELRIPPLCNDTMNEYLLRATTSVSCSVSARAYISAHISSFPIVCLHTLTIYSASPELTLVKDKLADGQGR